MISVKVCETQSEFNDHMDKLNQETAIFMGKAKDYYLSQCENDNVREIFLDWWNGKCVSTDKYKSQHNKEDLDMASSWILTAVSSGLG